MKREVEYSGGNLRPTPSNKLLSWLAGRIAQGLFYGLGLPLDLA